MKLTTEKVKECLEKGKSVIQIAEKYKVTRQAVYCHIDKIKKRKKKPVNFSKRNPKRNYNALINWKVYNEGLVRRGEILLDFEIFKNWEEELEEMNRDKVGAPYIYPDSFIIFLLNLKCIFQIDYRTTEGIARRLIVFIPRANKFCDYTTLQKRLIKLDCELKVYRKVKSKQQIAGDSSGLKTTNRGEYRMNKYKDGKRKKYAKLHLAVNIDDSQVVFCELTSESVSDGKKLKSLVIEAKQQGKITKGLFDAGYDSKENYWFLEEQGIVGGIRPRETMRGQRLEKALKEIKIEVKKNNNIELQKRLLRLEEMKKYQEDEEGWKKEKDYGQRWKVEGRFSVLKRLFGEYLFSKETERMGKEVILKINLMNKFAQYYNEAKKDYIDTS